MNPSKTRLRPWKNDTSPWGSGSSVEIVKTKTIKEWFQVSRAVVDRKCPRQVLSFADWSPMTICDSREKSNPCNNGSHVRMVDSILCSDGQKRVWVLNLSGVFYGLIPRGSMRQADDNCFNLFESFLFFGDCANDENVMKRTGCCRKAVQHQGESYSEVFSIHVWAGIDRVEQQRLRQPDVCGSWLTYESW